MNKAQIVHTLNALANHVPTKEDAFFARGRVATFLKRQALSLAYFKPQEHPYDESIKQIHRDFALDGTPYDEADKEGWQEALPADLRIVAKHFYDTCQGKYRLEVEGLWVILDNGSLMLKPLFDNMVHFESIDLHSGRILYNHELESVTLGTKKFLVKEDCYSFSRLVDDIRKRIS